MPLFCAAVLLEDSKELGKFLCDFALANEKLLPCLSITQIVAIFDIY